MRAVLAVLAAATVLAAGCGVGSEDEPRLIEESTPPSAPPSFDTQQTRATGSGAPTTVPGTSSGPEPTG